MAALLAWALGGTLFPRPEVVDYPHVTFKNAEWWLRMKAGGDEPGAIRWYLMEKAGGKTFKQPHLHSDDAGWLNARGPIVANQTLYVGFEDSLNGWQIAVFEHPAPMTRLVPALDRLAVERQLARVSQGLPLQDLSVERAVRADVLDAGDIDSESESSAHADGG